MSKKQDKIKDTILRSTENSVASVADDNVKANMEVETGAGMEPKILRSSDGKCCAWCSSLVGEYYEDEAPDDIYARHDNCNCTVTYISEKGYQDAHTKKWIDQQELEVRRERIATDRKNISKLKEGQEAEKEHRIRKGSTLKEKPYSELISDVNRSYYQTQGQNLKRISDHAIYKIAKLPKSEKHELLDGSIVFIEGQSLKRILGKHGKEFDLKEFGIIRDAIASPDCIALNDSHHKKSLLLYKEIKWSNKSIMECVFIREGKNIVIHYHKINKKKIRKLKKEGKIIENKINV